MKMISAIVRQRGFWVKAVIVALLSVSLAALVFEVNRMVPGEDSDSVYTYGYYKARVTAVLFDDAEPASDQFEGRRTGRQNVELVLTNGPHKGETIILRRLPTLM